MYVVGSRLWSALILAFGLAAPAVRAGMITPDSIPNPPSAVSSANGTPISASNLVTTQYGGLGLTFAGGAAITNLNGINVWAAVNSGTINFSTNDSLTGLLLSPGSLTPMTVSSLSLKVIGESQPTVYGLNGQQLNIIPVSQSLSGPQGPIGNYWTFTGAGIVSFSLLTVPIDSMGQGGPIPDPSGVAAVSFTTASAPEPSTLALAGLGLLGLASRLGWRRKWQRA